MRRRITPLLVVAMFVVAACGNEAVSETITTAAAAPTMTAGVAATTTPAGFPVVVRGTEIPALPERIVSLSATHTEILFALGAGPSVIATDDFSDHPAETAGIPKIDAFNLSVEAVADLDPDLVVLAFDPGEAVEGLAALGIPAVLFSPPGPSDLDGVYSEIVDVGTAVGYPEEAQNLVESMSSDIDEILGGLPAGDRATFFFELDSTLFSAGEGTLIDSVMTMLGLDNVADPADGPYPQLSAEFLIGADPDFIFLADTLCCGQSAATVAERPGWGTLTAVAEGTVVELDDSLASRWGPRIVDLMRTIAGEVYGTG